MVEDSLIVIAGATGDLGGRIVAKLMKMKAPVRALIRQEVPADKKAKLVALGCEVHTVNFNDSKAMLAVCEGGRACSICIICTVELQNSMLWTMTAIR
jgi:uncharacterized protein YbjT (DUF2867 family)